MNILAYRKNALFAWGIYLYSFSLFLGHVISTLGLVILILVLVANYREVREKFKDPYLLGILVFALIIWLSAIFSAILNDFTHLSEQAYWAYRYSKFVIYLAVLYLSLLFYEINLLRIFLAILAGFSLKIIFDFDIQDLNVALSGGRTGFAHPINHAGFVFSTLLIPTVGMLIWSGAEKFSNKSLKWLQVLGLIFLFVLLLWLLLVTGSRGSWLAFFAGVLIILAMLYRALDWKVIGILLLASVAVVTYKSDMILKRADVMKNFFVGVVESDSRQDVLLKHTDGVRWAMIDYGFQSFLKRPILGWGVGTSINSQIQNEMEDVIDPKQAQIVARYGHLHNEYVTILAKMGIMGGLVFAYLLFAPIVRMRSIKTKTNITQMTIKAIFFALIVSQLVLYVSHSRLHAMDYQLVLALILALASNYHRLSLGRTN